MRILFASLSLWLLCQPLASSAEIVQLVRPQAEVAAEKIDKYLNSSSSLSAFEAEDLRVDLKELTKVPGEKMLALIWLEAALSFENPELSPGKAKRIELLLRIPFQPSAEFEPAQVDPAMKMAAVHLLYKFTGSSLTEKAVIEQVNAFALWNERHITWALARLYGREGLATVYPALVALGSILPEAQRNLVEAELRELEPSQLKLAALLQIDRLNEGDLRIMLRLGAEMYATKDQNASPFTPGWDRFTQTERDAFRDAVYGLIGYIRANENESLRVFNEERERALASYSAFDKRYQFYKNFLQPSFDLTPKPVTAKTPAKIVYDKFNKYCEDALK